MQLRMATLQLLRISRPRMTSEKAPCNYSIQETLPALYKNYVVGVVKRSMYKTQLLNSQSTLTSGNAIVLLHILKPSLRYCKASIPFSQALQLRRICSDDRIYTQRTHELKQHFLSRGYHKQHLENEFKRALNTPRKACLQSESNQEKSAHIPLVVTYHPFSPSFYLTTKRHLSILHASERLWRAFEHLPLIAFHCPRNLRDLLVHSTLTSKSHE